MSLRNTGIVFAKQFRIAHMLQKRKTVSGQKYVDGPKLHLHAFEHFIPGSDWNVLRIIIIIIIILEPVCRDLLQH